MYAIYKKQRVDGKDHFRLTEEEVCLFGCNKGLIPRLLKMQIALGQTEPYKWHIAVPSELDKTNRCRGSTLVIDLKPKQREKNVALYELLDVWGYSADEWTPIMLRLSGLFVDVDPAGIDRGNFLIADEKRFDSIYEYLYLDGTVSNGTLVGKWTAPPASPTNGALLFPDATKYFIQCIRKLNPELFV
jgi:hypothetical protein